MKTIKTLFAIAALSSLSVVSTSALAADDSPASLRVQQSLSQQMIAGSAQQAPTVQATFAETGMSTAAGRFQYAFDKSLIRGNDRSPNLQEHDVVNDAGKSVAATRVEKAINERA